MIVTIESTDADPVDLLDIANGSGAAISAEDTSVPGEISRTLTWATPPTDVLINVLWSKVSTPGNWQLSGGDVTVQFADDCTPLPANVTLDDLQVSAVTVAGFSSQDLSYDVELPNGTTVVPAVTATTTDATSSFVVNDAAGLPGSTTVVVTAMDMSTETYTINFTVADNPLVSNYCELQVYHLGIPAETASSIFISIANTSSTSMVVEIESADADAVDLLQINGAAGATISDEDTTVPGKISRTMTWGAPQTDVTLNVLWSKISTPGNWQLSGGDITVSFTGACPNIAQDPLTVTLDVSCTATPNPTSVRITGPWWGWDPNAGPIATDNGDGTWSAVLDPLPTADMEYLWVVDGVQENLIVAMQNGGTCAPITDFANYANRQWTVGSVDPQDVYNQCDACPLPPVSLTVEICDTEPTPTAVRMTGPFWGWDPNGGPIASDNGDGTWTVTLDPQPGADMEYLWIVDGVQENLIQSMIDGGTCAPVTDYANYANRLWTAGSPDVSDDVANQCNACGAIPLTVTVDMSCTNTPNPTEVRMTGAFWGWDPAGGPVASDNGDGTWTVTLDPAPTADMEYLWIADGVVENLVQEMIDGGTCAPITDFSSYANRLWTVGDPNITDNAYDQCDACGPQPLTLTVDVSCTATPNPTSVRITGPWWGWDPNAGPIAVDNGDGTWTATLDPMPTADMEYLWVVDGVQENLIVAMQNGGTCAPITDFANYANRQWIVGSPNVNEVYNQCDACPEPPLT
ncbi:MAG: hypothetical protein ACPGED_02790, partial [Flavobacteriales bacterium]